MALFQVNVPPRGKILPGAARLVGDCVWAGVGNTTRMYSHRFWLAACPGSHSVA